jgi:hypothetical protein
MAGKRGPQSFMKRQRELQKQRQQLDKIARRRERSAQKKLAQSDVPSPVAGLDSAPLGPITSRFSPLQGPS